MNPKVPTPKNSFQSVVLIIALVLTALMLVAPLPAGALLMFLLVFVGISSAVDRFHTRRERKQEESQQ